jgi:hypothetical protein
VAGVDSRPEYDDTTDADADILPLALVLLPATLILPPLGGNDTLFECIEFVNECTELRFECGFEFAPRSAFGTGGDTGCAAFDGGGSDRIRRFGIAEIPSTQTNEHEKREKLEYNDGEKEMKCKCHRFQTKCS